MGTREAIRAEFMCMYARERLDRITVKALHAYEPVACMIPPAGLFDLRGGWMARMECIKVHYAETFIVLSVERRYIAACIRLPAK